MIAITFALPAESRDFLRRLGDRVRKVAILHTGVGKKACQERLGPFLDAQTFDFLISSGFAGGIDDSLGVGDVFLAENFSDPALLARARDLLRCPSGRLLTLDRVIDHATERADLAREEGAAALDMETKWIAEVCAARKIPMLSLRVISDTAAAPFPAPPAVLFDLERQKNDALKLTAYLARHPLAIVRFSRFVRQIARARLNLAAALEALLP